MNESVHPGSPDGTFPESFGFLWCMNVWKWFGKEGGSVSMLAGQTVRPNRPSAAAAPLVTCYFFYLFAMDLERFDKCSIFGDFFGRNGDIR